MAAKNKTEWIRAVVFQDRLQITPKAFRSARAGGVLTEKKVHGINLIEWNESRSVFIDRSQFPARYTKAAIADRRKKNGKKNPPGKVDPQKKETEDDILTAGKSKLKAEAIKQGYLAKQAKLKFLKDSGLLIEVEVVTRTFEQIAGHLKKLILGVPNRVAGIYATTKDPKKIKKSLEKELKTCLMVLKYKDQ